MLAIRMLWTAATLWHTLAFAAGGVSVWQAYRALFTGTADPRRSAIIRKAERHLVASGIAIVATGAALAGSETYFANPKLWAKLLLVALWLALSLIIRKVAVPRLRSGDRRPMLWAATLSAGCWLYGAFLGIAKPLSQGVVSFANLSAGFLVTLLAGACATLYCENARTRTLQDHA